MGSSFAQRCSSLGITLVTLDESGRVVESLAREGSGIDREVVASPMFAGSLRRVATGWGNSDASDPVCLWPGCWVVPIPLLRRRQVCGHQVAVFVTRDLSRSEQFHAICSAAGLDHAAAARRIELECPPAADLDRWAQALRWMHDDLAALQRQAREIDDLTGQLGDTYEELNLIYKLSARMSVSHDPMDFLNDALTELREVVGLHWIALRISDDEPRLHGLRGKLLVSGRDNGGHDLLRHIGAGLIACPDPKPGIVDDTRGLHIEGLDALARKLLIVPIVRDGQCLAVLFGADKLDGSALSSVDTKLTTATMQNIAVFLENAMLYDDMQDIFLGTLHALVASIDAKDSYTFGHSERVAWLSRQIAAAAGLDPDTVERVYLSALVHDVGKIGIPESVLTKPTRLSSQEFEMIRAHPDLGVKIIERIPQMKDLIPGVRHHHERWAGGGYPTGLAGKDIPIFGRIICLADSFDAMSSSRTYRPAMSVQDVYAEIDKCSGTQFDPELTAAFLKDVDLARYYALLADHQYHESPLHQVMRKTA